MGRRTILLVAAALVAVLGTGLVWAYTQNVRTEAAEVNQPVTVLVAIAPIAQGTTAEVAAASVEARTIPLTAAATGALATTEPIAGMVALYPIFPGQQLIGSQWGKSSQTGALDIPKGKLAGSFQLGDPQRVAGFVNPGSKVAIFITLTADTTTGTPTPRPVPTRGSTPEPVATEGAEPQTRLLLSGIPVIAVGPSTLQTRTTQATGQTGTGEAVQNTEQIPTAILTLALTQEEMQRMIFASGGNSNATLWFGLTNDDSKVEREPVTTLENLFE